MFVCFICHIEISQTVVALVMFWVLLESPWFWWIGVHQNGLIMFRPTLQELLNIEKKLLKTIQQNQYLREIEVHFGIGEVIFKKEHIS